MIKHSFRHRPTSTLTTGLDDKVAHVFIASQTRYNVDGKGPTLNPGDVLAGTPSRTDNKLLITDLTPDAAQNNLPAGVMLSNIQIVELDSAANTAAGGLRTRDFASVNELKAKTQGAGNRDLYIAGNENFGTATKVAVEQLSFHAASGVTVDGGHDVTVVANGGAGVRVGNQNSPSVPTAQQVATGAVDVTLNNTAAGGVQVYGGTTVKATVTSTSNTGVINIGNTAANTGNTPAGAIANASGDVTVNTAGTGAVNVFGGDNVTVNSTALGGVGGAVGAITVGDVAYRDPSNLPQGNVVITETNQIAYNGLAGSANNNVVNGAISVFGGKDVSITTNGANAINVGQVGNAARENALNPTGIVTVTNTGIETAAAAGSINITGGTDVTVSTTGSNVNIGRIVNAVTDQASNPTGNVTVTQTHNGAGLARAITIDGGVDVTVNAKGQTVTIGNSVASAPTGAVVVNQADIFTGNTNAVLNGTNAGNVTVRGGTDVTVNTTGGNVVVGGIVGGVNTVPSGAVKITNTFGGVGADTVTVQGGTTVEITTTKTSGAISVGGAASDVLNAAGTALKDANLAPTGDVTIVNKTVSGSQIAYGTGSVDVYANGAETVSVTGGDVDNIIDVQSKLATGGPGAGKAVGASTLKNVVIDSLQVANGVSIRSDALENLTVTNAKAKTDVIAITNNTAAHALTITQGGNTAAANTLTVVDANAGSITVKDNGTASTATLRVDATKATAVTLENTAAATVKLDGVTSDIATVTLKGAGDATIVGALGTGNLSKALNVDASAATGTVTATLALITENDKVQEYKGGSGVDIITIGSNASGWGDKVKIDGGNGSADVLVANYAAAGSDVALGNAANVKGFEVLRLGALADSTGGAYDASGFSTVQVGAVAGNVTFSNTATGLTLDVLANTTDKTVIVTGANYSATNTALTVNLGSGTTAIAAAGGGTGTSTITANGIEALTVNAVGGNATAVNTATINGVASNGAATLTVGGSKSLNLTADTGFTSINAAGNTGSTVDVSNVAVSNAGVTFTGGAAKLTAVGSNDANVKALVTLAGSAAPNWAVTETAVVTIGVGANASIYTYTATGNATAAEVAAALAAAINANATTGPVVRTTVGASVDTTNWATQSGGNIVLQNAAAFEVHTTETGTNGTIADSLLGGQQVNTVVLTENGGNLADGETFAITINGAIYTTTAASPAATAVQFTTGDGVAGAAANLAAQITAANVPGISSAVAVGDTVQITSQLGQTNLITTATTGAGDTIVDTTTINMTTVNNEFTTGSGGGEYKAGLGGSFNTVTKKFGSGSETVNLSASTAKVDTLVLKEGAVVTDNGSKGGVTAFVVGSQSASDTVVFRNTADNATQAKTIVANAVTGVVNTLNNAANMAAVFDATGALNTKLANLTYTISNGVITFGATGGNSLSQFTVNELINAAQIIVSSSTTGGKDKVAAFSHNGKSYIVASDSADTGAAGSSTLGESTGAGSNTNNVVVELKDVASVKGFGSTFGEGTIVSSTVTNITNAAVDLAALATNSNLDYTGFAVATLAVAGTAAANTNATKFANLAASAELVVNAAGNVHLGLLETTQVGASGKNSLTVTQAANATTIDRLTVNGDALVRFQNGGQALTVTELVDATNTVNTIQVGAGVGTTTLTKIVGTALTNINTTAAGVGGVTLGNGTFTSTLVYTVTEAIAQSNLKFDLATANDATIFTSGAGNTFAQGTGIGVVKLVASGANNTITLSNGANEIVANGAGNTISVGTGVNTIVATGADVVFNVASHVNVTTITVGTNATVNLGTANGAAANEVIKVNAAVTGGDSSNFAKTTIAFAANVSSVGTVIDFDDDVVGVAFDLLGTTVANSQVNVASATSLAEALDLAANYTLLVQDQGTAVTTANLAANTAAITWFQYGGDTYVVAMVNDTGVAVQQTKLDANDIVVKLVGLHDLTGSAFNNAGGTETLII